MKVIQNLINPARLRDQTMHKLKPHENLIQYSAESVARAIAIWREANRAALNYSGPTMQEIKQKIAAADARVATAQAAARAAELALVKEYGVIDCTVPADPTLQIDISLVNARREAIASLNQARTARETLNGDLVSSQKHEEAKKDAIAILGELIGFSA